MTSTQLARLHADLADDRYMRLESPCQPSRIGVTSILTMSPSSQLPVAGDAVADDMVDRGADRFREAAVVQRRRDARRGRGEMVAQLVELAGGDAGLARTA